MPNPAADSAAYWHLLAQVTSVWASAVRTADHEDATRIARSVHHTYGPAGLLDLCTLALLYVDQRAAADVPRTSRGGIDLDHVLPDTADALTTLDTAAALSHGRPSAGHLHIADTVVGGITHARPTVQRALDAVPGDRDGARERVRTVLHDTVDDLLAVSALFALCGTLL